jgi:hypothetical protein
MVVTRQTVSDQLLAYLNHERTLEELVDWAENTFIDDVLEPDADVELLNDILGYLAATDSAQFPLTWELCADFMDRLGTPVRVVPVVA